MWPELGDKNENLSKLSFREVFLFRVLLCASVAAGLRRVLGAQIMHADLVETDLTELCCGSIVVV